MDSVERSRRTRCPICGKPVQGEPGLPGSVFPFCSARCRDVDLGRWLDGKYQIPVNADVDEATAPVGGFGEPSRSNAPTDRD